MKKPSKCFAPTSCKTFFYKLFEVSAHTGSQRFNYDEVSSVGEPTAIIPSRVVLDRWAPFLIPSWEWGCREPHILSFVSSTLSLGSQCFSPLIRNGEIWCSSFINESSRNDFFLSRRFTYLRDIFHLLVHSPGGGNRRVKLGSRR